MEAAKEIEIHLAGPTQSITDVAHFRPSSVWVTGYLWLNKDTFKPFRYFANFTLWLMIMVSILRYHEGLRQPCKAVNINSKGVKIPM